MRARLVVSAYGIGDTDIIAGADSNDGALSSAASLTRDRAYIYISIRAHPPFPSLLRASLLPTLPLNRAAQDGTALLLAHLI